MWGVFNRRRKTLSRFSSSLEFDMISTNVSPITPEHAKHFGFIITIFAQIELQMQVAVAGILNVDLATAIIMFNEMGHRLKDQTIRHLNTTVGVNGLVSRELIEILDSLNKISPLRNKIAHVVWKAGRNPDSIKPMQLLLRKEKPTPIGHRHNEKEYQLSEIEESARSIAKIQRRFDAFLKSSGLEERVAVKIDESKQ